MLRKHLFARWCVASLVAVVLLSGPAAQKAVTSPGSGGSIHARPALCVGAQYGDCKASAATVGTKAHKKATKSCATKARKHTKTCLVLAREKATKSCATKARKHTKSCLALARKKAKKKSDSTAGVNAKSVSARPDGYGPAQLRGAYNLPATAARSQTIAIVTAYDSPNIEQDLRFYSKTFSLPICASSNGCFRKVNGAGDASPLPSANALWALETSLDVEAAHAVCTNCKILLVEADSSSVNDLVAAVDSAARLGADVISNSWVVNEFRGETSLDSHFDLPGIAITAASGDTGYGVKWPAASPYVTAVGGTTLDVDASNARVSESAWEGASSGCSAYESKPTWQSDAGCAQRTVPDVAAVADPNTGAAVYDSYGYSGRRGWFKVGGTSLAAPIVAAVYALAGNAADVVAGSYPYSHSTALSDIQQGTNGTCSTSYLCTAGPGYDGPTGLGTPAGIGAF
ncbi:MAG: S8 family serine peptidase [Gaiellaceae bacterium]